MNILLKKHNKRLISNKLKQFFYINIIILLNIFLIMYVAKVNNNDKFYDYFSAYKNVIFCYVTKLNKETTSSRVVRASNCQFVYFDIQTKKVKPSDAYYKQLTMDSGAFDNKKVFQDLNIHIVKCEKVNSIDIIYGYSPSFSKSIVVGGQKINFQLALSKNKITIGCPIIFGSY